MSSNELSIEDEMRSLWAGTAKESVDEVEDDKEVVQEQPSDTDNKVTEEEVVEVKQDEPPKTVIEAPISLSASMKEKWKDLPEDVQKEWSKRENDMHRMMTSQDGELQLGRKMKDVITPYMATIHAEGGTPEGAVKDLLNTAYVLRTGSPHQKAQLMQQVMNQYGIDMSLVSQNQNQIDPNIAFLQQRIDELTQKSNPEVIKNQLQEQIERDNISREVSSFAADPKNQHFETVRSSMGPLMMSGQAKTLQEAYDMACWSNPTIRSTMLQAEKAQEQAKQKEKIEAKKKAAASVTGSPGLASPQNRTPPKSLEDELRDGLNEARGNSI